MLWGENRGKWKGRQPPGVKPVNPRHLWLESPVLCHWAMTAGRPPTLTILYMYCTGGTECLSHTPGSHLVCAAGLNFHLPLFLPHSIYFQHASFYRRTFPELKYTILITGCKKLSIWWVCNRCCRHWALCTICRWGTSHQCSYAMNIIKS